MKINLKINGMHWTKHYRPAEDCQFPFEVFCVEDYVGVHPKTEISIKKGDLLKVYGECDPEGHNTTDVPRTSKRVNGVMNVKYPVWDPQSPNFWIGELIQYEPSSEYYAKHKIGHFPIRCVQPNDIYLWELKKKEASRESLAL